MLQVARLAPTLLGDSSSLVTAFLHRALNADGGFRDRAGESDLYYTVFGLEGLLAFGEQPPDTTAAFLQQFEDGASLDFVHLTCLARAWASATRHGAPPQVSEGMRARIERYRAQDGGYAASRGAEAGSPYACFLAAGALQDLGAPIPDAGGMLRSLDAARAADGAYANHRGSAQGSTPATAAAVLSMRHLEREPDPALVGWLLARAHTGGGFFASPLAPIPDLLSTATALHALAALHADLTPVREPCLDFVDSLWSNVGGFCGSWADPAIDCEYTYYGLLALGHLRL